MNLDLFLAAPLVIQIHALAAFAALGIAVWMLAAPKGTFSHRTFGRAFIVMMATVAVTAIFIRQINDGAFSFIHVFVPLTAFGIFGGLRAILFKKDVKAHRNAMFGLVFGALTIPGLFAFMPGRLLHQVVFGG